MEWLTYTPDFPIDSYIKKPNTSAFNTDDKVLEAYAGAIESFNFINVMDFNGKNYILKWHRDNKDATWKTCINLNTRLRPDEVKAIQQEVCTYWRNYNQNMLDCKKTLPDRVAVGPDGIITLIIIPDRVKNKMNIPCTVNITGTYDASKDLDTNPKYKGIKYKPVNTEDFISALISDFNINNYNGYLLLIDYGIENGFIITRPKLVKIINSLFFNIHKNISKEQALGIINKFCEYANKFKMVFPHSELNLIYNTLMKYFDTSFEVEKKLEYLQGSRY